MLFWISKQIAGIFGLDISVVQKRVLLAAIVLGLVVIIASGLWLKSCFTKTPSLSEKQIQKNQEAIASQDRKRLEQAFAESRTAEKKIDANRADAENQTLRSMDDARKESRSMTNEELAAYLESLK